MATIRSKYDSQRMRVSVKIPSAEKRTKDSFKDECDINRIVKRAQAGAGIRPPTKLPFYGDFSSVPDYLTARNIMLRAEETFYNLPAAVRAECQNEPAIFLDKVQKDKDFVQRHGLAKAAPPAPPAPPAAPEAPKGEGSPK